MSFLNSFILQFAQKDFIFYSIGNNYILYQLVKFNKILCSQHKIIITILIKFNNIMRVLF